MQKRFHEICKGNMHTYSFVTYITQSVLHQLDNMSRCDVRKVPMMYCTIEKCDNKALIKH